VGGTKLGISLGCCEGGVGKGHEMGSLGKDFERGRSPPLRFNPLPLVKEGEGDTGDRIVKTPREAGWE
jgi:hypothetical protein